MNRLFPTLLIAIVFAMSQVILRAAVLVSFGDAVSGTHVLSTSVSLVGHFSIGLFVSYLALGNSRLLNIIALMTVVLICILNIFTYHYEAVFGRLPGINIFYYLTELKHLSSSVEENAPLVWIVSEFIFLMLIFYVSVYKFKSISIWVKSKFILIIPLSAIIITFLIQTTSAAFLGSFYWGAQTSLLWLLKSAYIERQISVNLKEYSKQELYQYQSFLGHRIPFASGDESQPLCGQYEKPIKDMNNKNVIFIILEGVSEQELYWTIDGRSVMPNLQRIVQENLYFDNMFAAGTKSNQALIGLFTGLPPQTNSNILWKRPLPELDSFIKNINSSGYQTVYLHGSDLSFEQQRDYLKNIGFKEIIEPVLDEPSNIYGWGFDDGTMFKKLKMWIEDHHKKVNDKPYFASLFTLSTHDPYILPNNWKPFFSEFGIKQKNHIFWNGVSGMKNNQLVMADAFHFLDEKLGEFYQWYQVNERGNNTLLLLVGDHSPHLYSDFSDYKTAPYYRMPFIISGVDTNEFSRFSHRLAAHHDIPATISHLLNVPQSTCDQGVNLLSENSYWSDSKIVYANGGDQLEHTYFWAGGRQLHFDRVNAKLTFIDNELPYNTTKIDEGIVYKNIVNFINILYKINAYIDNNNAYSSPKNILIRHSSENEKRERNTIFVSHRGNTQGGENKAIENSDIIFNKVIASGMKWIEVDVQLTHDGIPVLSHDPEIQLPDGKRQWILALTLEEIRRFPSYQHLLTLDEALFKYASKLNFLIEVKPQKHVSQLLYMSREISRLIKKYKSKTEIIVDSFNLEMITSINHYCECATAIDAPFKQKISEPWIKSIKKSGLEWIYVHYDVLDEAMINMIHRNGMKVIAYTVNDSLVLKKWKRDFPDGVITDYSKLANMEE